jgi:MFS-type transporter involved in bile tolerance (Atg22 family)
MGSFVLDALITCATALFLANFWSQWRYRFFDYFCAVAAIVGAFALPALAERFTPALADLGILAFDAGGALLGCLVYDAAAWRRG